MNPTTRDLNVSKLAATMTYREMDNELRALAGRPLSPAELDRVHLLGSAQAQQRINASKIG